MKRVVVVGGGVSGLAAACYLSRDGHTVTLLEPAPRLGGVIRTDSVDGCVVEAGPDSWIAQKPAAARLARDVGLGSDLIASNDHLRKTYILRRGRFRPMPDGLFLMVPTAVAPIALTPLLGLGTKLRMAIELLRRPAAAPLADRSVAAFVRDHYGDEAVRYLAEPLLAGIYGGDPEQLSAPSVLGRLVEIEQRHGSLSRGVLAGRRANPAPPAPLFQSLRGGMQQLVDSLARAIDGSVTIARAEAACLERRDPAGFRITGPAISLEADHVVLAVPAHAAAPLVRSLDPSLAGLLGSIQYHSSITVALAFDAAAFRQPLDGFGFLIPKVERRLLTAGTWVGTKFPHRVPGNRVLLRAFIGAGDRDDLLGQSDEALLAAVADELRALLNITTTPVFTRLHRWPRAMCQYTVGHAARIAEINLRLASLPRLHLAGNAYLGIGVPDCISSAQAAASRVSATI